jgi:Kef-type K+ transport system membrane component KefB
MAEELGILALGLALAWLLAMAASRLGQPPVLGELLAGMLLGKSFLGMLEPEHAGFHFLAELGIILLLLEIGLESDERQLLGRAGTASAVAVVGVFLPLVLGYVVCRFQGYAPLPALVAGAALTATSVGITARVLADLRRLTAPESQIILAAAVLDDVLGLVILAGVAGLAQGQVLTGATLAQTAALAVLFLGGTALAGWLVRHRRVIPWLARRASDGGHKTPLLPILAATLALAWLADRSGLAPLLGAFAAGLILRQTRWADDLPHRLAPLGQFLIPFFFLRMGAALDLSVFRSPAGLAAGGLAILLLGMAILGKFLAGYAPWWFRGRKAVIGAGMIPRGEVGLIFAQMGQESGVLDAALFAALLFMVLGTTGMTPPLLRYLFGEASADPAAPAC